MNDHPSYVERLWETGQQHLAALRYGPAVRALEAAEAAAWRSKDGPALARLYLPLLEARRQIRYQAAEGTVILCPPGTSENRIREAVRRFTDDSTIKAGTLLVGGAKALQHAAAVQHAARRSGRWIEALLLLNHRNDVRLASPADPAFAAGLDVQWTNNPTAMIGAATDANLQVPLPPAATAATAATFNPGHPLHPMIRESVITAWEALALKWQHRHPPHRTANVWEEIAWLRRALRIDPACEPIAMRLMSLAESADRKTEPVA